MKAMAPYLNFDGNCREAVTFYKKCLNWDLQMMTFAELTLYALNSYEGLGAMERLVSRRSINQPN